MRQVAFTPIAFKEYNDWFEDNPKMIERIKIYPGQMPPPLPQ